MARQRQGSCKACRMLRDTPDADRLWDHRGDDFCILRGRNRIWLLVRGHSPEPPSDLVGSMEALKDLGLREWGNAFTLDGYSQPFRDHWAACASPLRMRTATSPCPSPSPVVLCPICGETIPPRRLRVSFDGDRPVLRCPAGCIVPLRFQEKALASV